VDKPTEDYYNNYFNLFNNDGWKQLVEELTANAVNIDNVQALKDKEDMNIKKGQLMVLASLINLEASINSTYEELTSDVESI
tara:strand:- start:1466 stop:1711 length:246 start_codon:yes stop_codon:yes gene_type:complete